MIDPPRSVSLRQSRRSYKAPAAQGFRMPAEWEPHRATWLVWPHNRDDWEVKSPAIDWCYVEIIKHLVGTERVAILLEDETVERRALKRLRQAGVDLRAVDRYYVQTNRSWIRDSGPIFITRAIGCGRRREIAITDWGFNGWARYRKWQKDNTVPKRLAHCLGMRRFPVISTSDPSRSVVLEGGSIDSNGEGLLLTTEECLLGRVQVRNPGMTRTEIEHVLRDHLAARRVLWLTGGIVGDDTHGHVDDVARFVSADTVVAAVEKDRRDINHAPLADNLAKLRTMTDLNGRMLRVVPLPMPRPICFNGVRLPASYLNFYIANGTVLVPTFNDPSDRIALARLAKLFPSRSVVGIHAGDLILGLGSIHCITKQEPSDAGNIL